MAPMKKRVRIKTKNFLIFIVFIMIFCFAIYQIVFITIKLITTENKEKKEVVETTPKKKLSTYEEKLKKLGNVNDEVTYFKKSNIDRYLAYKKKNKDLSNIQVVKDVNMNLDLTAYKNEIKALNIGQKDIIVNKYYYLDKDYVPKNLEKISRVYALDDMKLVDYAKVAFEKMAKEAAKEDLTIIAMSAYRSYDYQIDLYKRYKRQDGEGEADTYSGRAGHSEHQTGLAVDVYNKEKNYTSFGSTEEYQWMLKNAHKYGFILRFPKDKEKETGYQFEAWHYRYVGVKTATYIKNKNISFEEYIATK